MAVEGSDKELPKQEDTDEEQLYAWTAETRHAETLLDISEEENMKELEPHEYHLYPGWEEVGRGWARVAPMSGILLVQKKLVDNQSSSSVDPTLSNADSSGSVAEDHCESHAGPSNSLKKNTTRKREKRETPLESHNLSSKYPVSEYRPSKPQKHSYGPISTLVPIKNFSFSPPTKSQNLNPKFGGQLCNGKKSSDGEALDENGFMFDKKSRTRGTRAEPVANVEFHTYSAALSPKPDTVHHTGYSVAGASHWPFIPALQ